MKKIFKKSFYIGLIIGTITSIGFVAFVYYISMQNLEIIEKNKQNFDITAVTISDLQGNKIDIDSIKDKNIFINF